MDQNWLNNLGILVQAFLTLAGLIVAWMLYGLAEAQRRDSWRQALTDFHRDFWEDDQLARVRSWIACSEAYSELKPVLEKRNAKVDSSQDSSGLDTTEYERLEAVDRFAALILGYKKCLPRLDNQKEAFQRLFDDYWLRTAWRREELRRYLEDFYPELAELVAQLPKQEDRPFA